MAHRDRPEGRVGEAARWGSSLRSRKPTRRPVGPPTRLSAPETPLAALAMAGPAAAVTRDRPSVALAVTSDALAETSDAVFFAVSAAFVVVVDSKRTMLRPIERPDRLMTRAKDILEQVSGEGKRVTIDRSRTQK